MDGLQERFMEFLAVVRPTNAELAKAWAVNEKTVNNYRYGRTDISRLKAELLLAHFIDISPKWLIDGKGGMKKETIDVSRIMEDGAPLVNIDMAINILSGRRSAMAVDARRYKVPELKDADFYYRISGDEMSPTYIAGDVVACKDAGEDCMFIQYGRCYIIDTDHGILVKRIRRSDDDTMVVLESDNVQKYDSYEMSKRTIRHLALIMGMIRCE